MSSLKAVDVELFDGWEKITSGKAAWISALYGLASLGFMLKSMFEEGAYEFINKGTIFSFLWLFMSATFVGISVADVASIKKVFMFAWLIYALFFGFFYYVNEDLILDLPENMLYPLLALIGIEILLIPVISGAKTSAYTRTRLGKFITILPYLASISFQDLVDYFHFKNVNDARDWFKANQQKMPIKIVGNRIIRNDIEKQISE